MEATLLEKAILRREEAEVLAQGFAFVLESEEVAALQFVDEPVDEFVEAAWLREHDVEVVAVSL